MLNIVLLGITSLLTDISSEMVYPLLPAFLVMTLGAGPAILGVIEGAAESLASILKVFSGYFSDRVKARKSFTISGYAASGVGKLMLFLAGNWSGVFVGRLIDRFGKGVRTAPRDALIADSTVVSNRGMAFGLHRSLDTLGAVIGVLAAYFLITNFKGGLRSVFLLSLIPAFLGVLVLFLVRDKRPAVGGGTREIPRWRWGALDRRLKAFLIFSFVFTLGNSSNQFLLLRAQTLGNPLPRVLLFYLFYNIIYALASYPAGRISDKIGRRNILVLGYLFYGLVYLGFAWNNSVGGLWLLFGMYGLYIGFTEGVEKALIVDIAPAGLKATALGLQATLVGIGLLPASLLAGLLWKFFGAQVPFYFAGLVGVVSSIALLFILRKN